MQQALPVDWDTIRAAYMSHDVPLREIASKFNVQENTLRKRIQRNGWHKAKANGVQVMSSISVEIKQKPEKPRSLALRESLAEELEADLQAIKAVKPKGVASASKRQQVISAIVSNAKVVHGWGEAQSATMLNLSVLSGQDVPDVQTLDIPSCPIGTSGDQTPLSIGQDGPLAPPAESPSPPEGSTGIPADMP